VAQRLRAPIAATIALLIGGDLVAGGVGALFDARRWLFPYLWLFLLFEAARARRRLLDGEAFLFGAAIGLLHDGVYAKLLQEGTLLLGIDWLGALVDVFDWGMVAVVSLHVADAILPRLESGVETGPWERVVIVAVAFMAGMVYLTRTIFGLYRYERMIGSTWLLADLLFAAGVWTLARHAYVDADRETPPERDRWLLGLAAFCVWVPGAQALARAGADWPDALLGLCLASWAAAVGWCARRLWVERDRADHEPRRVSPFVLGLAGWRLAGAVLICGVFGSAQNDDRAVGAFSLLVELPTRAVFAYALFTSRLRV